MRTTTRRFRMTAVFVSMLLGAFQVTAQPRQGIVCRSAVDRDDEIGCWIIARQIVGELQQPEVFWYLDAYTNPAAAEAAKGPHGTVVEALGKVWLLSIEGATWPPANGERIAVIGPLPVVAGTSYTAQYMEAIFTPGMTSETHTHPGPEAWYTMAGATCLETPQGKQIGRAGGPPVIVPGGIPMHLTAIGAEQRRSLVLILHESSKPSMSMTHDWTPTGLCLQ
jgi:quercetin dioxygenase-like cupin family protein